MEHMALEFAKTCVTLQETYAALRESEAKAAAATERMELMDLLMKGWHATEDISKTFTPQQPSAALMQ